jgi:hypothetical protein
MVEFTYAILFAMTLLSAVLVVFSTHTVYSALYLIVTMISISGIFILINAPAGGGAADSGLCRRDHDAVPFRNHAAEPEERG